MALINTPSWLIPTDVVGAMSAGGRLGLGRAQIGENAREADMRTGLGYAQLGADQASAGAALHAKLAEHALALALHQSESEEKKRKNMAMEQLRGQAIQEAARKDAASEALRQKQFEELGKRQTQKEEAAMKLAKYKSIQSQLNKAQSGYLASQANDKPEDAKRYQQQIAEITQQLQQFESPAAATAPSAGESLMAPSAGVGNLAFPPIFTEGSNLGLPMPRLGQPIPGLDAPAETKSGNRYTIEPVGE